MYFFFVFFIQPTKKKNLFSYLFLISISFIPSNQTVQASSILGRAINVCPLHDIMPSHDLLL